MDELLSLKWSNHCPTFINMLSILREKELYTDATLACNGKFYNVHKLVLSTCSDYFSAMLDQTNCKNPVVVLKDVKCQDLEALLDYMYLGEVVVRQSDLTTLIKAAEGLRIKGLAVPDDETLSKTMLSGKDSTNKWAILSDKSPPTKRKRTSDESNAGFAAKEVKLSAPTHSSPSQRTNVPHSTLTYNSHNIAENSTTSPSRSDSQINTQSPYKAANQCKITSNSLDADTKQTFNSFDSELNVKKEKDSSDGSDLSFVEDTCKEETSENRDCLEESQTTKTDALQEYLSQINSNQRNDGLLSPSSDCTSGFNNNDGMSGWRSEEEVGLISAAAECQSQISSSAAVTTLTPSPDRSPSKDSRLSGLERLSFADTLLGCVFPSSFTSGFTSNTSSPYPSTSSSTFEGIGNHVIGSSRFDYTCFYCGKNFLFVSKLKEHLRTHTGERPFQCSFCSYRATRVWVLKRHVLTVHNREGPSGAASVHVPDQHPLDASSGGGEDVLESGAAALLDAAVAAGVFSLPPPQSPNYHRARETVGAGLLQCLRAAGSTASSNV